MAVQLNFTNRSIESIQPPVGADRSEFKDTKVPGLYLRVTPSGVKTFSYVGRAKGAGRPERATLGRFPALKADEARRLALEISGRLASGAGSVAKANRERRGEITLGALWVAYSAALPPKAKSAAEGPWRLHVEPTFAKRRLSELTPVALERWHKTLPALIVRNREAQQAERAEQRRALLAAKAELRTLRRRGPDPKPRGEIPERTVTGERAANQALNLIRAMYSWATKPTNRLFDGANPAAQLTRFREMPRRRFLQPDELRPFFEALAAEPNETMRDFFLVALLTGARRSNVTAMRWKALHLQRAEWVIDGNETKNGEPHTVTLIPEVVEILRHRRKASKSPFVFPSIDSKSGHIVEPGSAWRRVLTRAGIADLRIHDLRRTLGSWQLRTGASLALIGKSLNHLSQDATAIYAQLDLDPIRQSVGRATSAMFEAAGFKPAADVLKLPARQPEQPQTRTKSA
jgi:integrase